VRPDREPQTTKASPTIVGDTGCTTAGLVHPYVRKLTIAEIKALASYPEEFQLIGSYRARWARIGNSVPPLFMKAIADRIRQHIFMNESSAP
jgi:DNA (cytosine-5)-methyltransferase 1